MRSLLKNIKNKLFKDYSTDIALRYLPVVEVIRKSKYTNDTILEVGSGDLGITPYLKRKVIGLDVVFGSLENDLLQKVGYNGSRFPFDDNKFDLVIGVDSLEHIAKDKRQEFINEIARVAKKAVIVVVPSGIEAYELDKELADYFNNIHGYYDTYLSEHIENGLPENNEVFELFKNAAKIVNKKIKLRPPRKLSNLQIQKCIMKCSISRNIILSILYYLFILLLPVRKFINFGKCYRQLFFVEVK